MPIQVFKLRELALHVGQALFAQVKSVSLVE